MIEQIPPVTSWGTIFYVMPLVHASYTMKILASKDSTNVKIYCNNVEETVTVNEGQHYSKMLTLEQSCAVIANNPVLVVQFCHSYMFYSLFKYKAVPKRGDPMMMIIPDTLQYSSTFSISTPQVFASYEHHINLVVIEKFFKPDKIHVVSGGSEVYH